MKFLSWLSMAALKVSVSLSNYSLYFWLLSNIKRCVSLYKEALSCIIPSRTSFLTTQKISLLLSKYSASLLVSIIGFRGILEEVVCLWAIKCLQNSVSPKARVDIFLAKTPQVLSSLQIDKIQLTWIDLISPDNQAIIDRMKKADFVTFDVPMTSFTTAFQILYI